MNMLEYSKLILEKVSFDAGLFENELRKSKRNLFKNEIDDLRNWCNDRFGERYKSTIQKHLGVRAEK
ncbi:MAG: hypothetical protein OHK0057_33840 [Thermoflexibacter sp.]|uniref:Transposase n=1 Tax=Thermoflexibacter ruber TaxID=1003 RepID=A0A1I2JAK0_9BACT|nr:hypothetical protein [Thermoflexibacter ruber]SFF51872.1 hypothetical protein SAMN04488541_104623 [Thermoflexibacter ruber]